MINLVVVEKEIWLFGKKEVHKVLCMRYTAINGVVYDKPLKVDNKGNDGNYYSNYLVCDSYAVGTEFVEKVNE